MKTLGDLLKGKDLSKGVGVNRPPYTHVFTVYYIKNESARGEGSLNGKDWPMAEPLSSVGFELVEENENGKED